MRENEVAEGTASWYQLGYIPRSQNRKISLYLQSDWNPYIAEVQRLQPDKHPQQQVEVGLFLAAKEAKS